MEYTSGIKIRDIFIHNGNWWKLFIKHHHCMRFDIISNVTKMLSCRTSLLGFHLLTCPLCSFKKKVPHSCKSRVCSSCGKKATDTWINNAFNSLPDTTWQHITFTIDSHFQMFFPYNRHLLGKLPSIAANIILNEAKKQDFLPGIFLAIHTFGRDLKFNAHIHLSTTLGGLSISHNRSTWIHNAFFHHLTLKRQWKYAIFNLLRNEFKNGTLILPHHLKSIRTYTSFNSWLNSIYLKSKEWVVFLNKKSNNKNRTISYLGKYIKRPPIGETRIASFSNNIVSFSFLDHYSKQNKLISIHALDFIDRFIRHIPDKYFRLIRYYGFLSNRLRSSLLPRVNSLLNLSASHHKKPSPSWRNLIFATFGVDPKMCPACNALLRSANHFFLNHNIFSFHKEIAHGYFQLL